MAMNNDNFSNSYWQNFGFPLPELTHLPEIFVAQRYPIRDVFVTSSNLANAFEERFKIKVFAESNKISV